MPRRKASKNDRAKALQQYQQGTPVNDLAKQYGVSRAAVYQWLRKNGKMPERGPSAAVAGEREKLLSSVPSGKGRGRVDELEQLRRENRLLKQLLAEEWQK